MFWPNNLWKLFYYIILWHIFSQAYFQHFLSFGAGDHRKAYLFHMKYVFSIYFLTFSFVTLAYVTYLWVLLGVVLCKND